MTLSAQVRRDFPLISAPLFRGAPWVYFDNAATTQKPRQVIERMADFYRFENANIHRGVYELGQKTTDRYEQARETVRSFLGAARQEEVIFTRGTTEGINLVAAGLSTQFKEGDELLVSVSEHHANLVPWQYWGGVRGAKVIPIPIEPSGQIDSDSLKARLSKRTKLVALTHVSNVLGVVNPIKKLVEEAQKVGAKVLVDGAQAVSHGLVDVQDLGCDFYVFSAHKVLGPTGVGVLYGKAQELADLPPYQYGGGMIDQVDFAGTTYAPLPQRLEAGTPPIAEVLGLSEAILYLRSLGWEAIQREEQNLTAYFLDRLSTCSGLQLFGMGDKVPVFSFTLDQGHPYDLGTILGEQGIAVRVGHHCAQPLMKYFGVSGMVRASLMFYNTEEEIDRFIEGLSKALVFLAR